HARPRIAAVLGAEDRELAVVAVAEGEAAPAVPEGEAVVERVGVLVLEGEPPRRPAVGRVVDARGRTRTDGERERFVGRERLHVAEGEGVRPRPVEEAPRRPAVRGTAYDAGLARHPDGARVHDVER